VVIEEKISKVNGEIVVKKYQLGKELWKCGYAKFYEITDLETKRLLAAKMI
jgi:polo-like kinase 1